MSTDATVTDNPEANRFELRQGEELIGRIDYVIDGDVIDMQHTIIDPAHGGRGHGGTVTRAALDAARERGLRVIPSCPFIVGWIDKNPDYADLVHDA